MCGIFALFGNSLNTDGVCASALSAMRSRGPDGQGIWREGSCCMGHNRLAILDLDDRASQPMISACGRYVIVFNGEIYNFCELQKQLEAKGDHFKTSSDTEVLLALFAREQENMLHRLHGMFAFVIWDKLAQRAFVARDSYGIKPLYFAVLQRGVVVASQVKAIIATGLVNQDPCPHGQASFWMLGSIAEPHTWFRSIKALPAGGAMWIKEGQILRQWCWHDIGAAWRDSESLSGDVSNVRRLVGEALVESVDRHLVSDVPIGVFLSGGIDSGALAGLFSERAKGALTGVTLAFDEFAGSLSDESKVAAQIAAHYGIRHCVRRVSRAEFLSDLPRILNSMDQPSIDGVNTWYASKAIAELGLKVVISGVGGDELFQGYSHFRKLPKLLKLRGLSASLPGAQSAWSFFGKIQARRTGNSRWAYLGSWARTIEGAWWLRRSINTPDSLVQFMGPDMAAAALRDFDSVDQVRAMTGPLSTDPLLAIGQIESMTYLRNQLLRDSDWGSMAHSVELRTPLVDAHLLSNLQSLLPAFRKYPGKSLLAQAPCKPLPPAVANLPKTGFGIPMANWLKDRTKQGETWQQSWMRMVSSAVV